MHEVDHSKVIKNVYACLVHENIECIIDLISNLRYHDASSEILVYNGGADTNLLKNNSLLNKYEAMVHPSPLVIKHGYLHPFAFDCMEYAVNNFSFDCLTIVDSDQLAIRSGYSEYLGEFFLSKSNIGLLANNTERIDGNSTNQVALQAFNEYHVWKPLLANFNDGENSFVYWTFWPSTVFTHNACRDLVKLFKESSELQYVMEHTKIWASEEVILPTLVKLLGYEITLNPCSYEYVQYKRDFTVTEVNEAFIKPDAYWLHPVERIYNSTLRKYLREHFYDYEKNKRNENNYIVS